MIWTVVLKKTLVSPLDCIDIQPVIHPKGDESWVFTGRIDVEAEITILWPPDAESWLIWKDPDAGKDWGQKEKGTTEYEMVGQHHRHNGHGFGWTPGVGDGQRGLACCSSWVTKRRKRLSDWTALLYNGYLCIKAFQVVLVVKNLPANTGYIRDRGLVPQLGRSSGAGHGNPLQ